MLAVNHLTLLDVPAFKASVSLPVMKGEMYIKKKSHQTLSFGNQESASSSPVLHKGGESVLWPTSAKENPVRCSLQCFNEVSSEFRFV